MTDYQRHRVPGGTLFFTVNLFDRRSSLLIRHIDILREAVRQTQRRSPIHIDAWVVLPDHMHCVWTLPDGDTDFSSGWHNTAMLATEKMMGFTAFCPSHGLLDEPKHSG